MADRGRDRPNRGQDENTHTYVDADGNEVQQTQRWFRETGRAQGYRQPEDADVTEPAAPAEPTAEPPA
jgi:hypothetical protein